MKKMKYLVLLLVMMAASVGLFAQTQTFYAKNSGDWNSFDNWTTDASGLVYTNPSEITPGIRLTGCNVSVNAGRTMKLTLPIGDGDDAIVIDELLLNGNLVVERPNGNTQKIIIKKLLGKGSFSIPSTQILHLDPTTDIAADRLFDMSEFKGTVVFNANNVTDESNFGNPLISLGYPAMPMPSSTLKKGKLYMTTDYIIDGDLIVEEDGEFVIRPGINIEVRGNIINRGKIVSSSDMGADAVLKVYGDIDNHDGTLELWSYDASGKKKNNTITEFVGNKESRFMLNNSSINDNTVFRIVCNKSEDATLRIYSTNNDNCLKLAAVQQLNSGNTYKDMPFVIEQGTLDLGYGVKFGGDATTTWWNAVAPIKSSSFDKGCLSFSKLAHTKGSIYIKDGATLSITGADVTIGDNNPVFVSGQIIINSGSFTTGKPGIFYVYPIKETEDGNIISPIPSRMTINGGDIHASRTVSLDTDGKSRPIIHSQSGGLLAYDRESVQWDDSGKTRNKTLYIGNGSQFVMHGGELKIAKDAVGAHETYEKGGEKVQILMEDLENNTPLPILIDGGQVTVSGTGIIAYINSFNNVLIENGADVTLVPIDGGVTINGNIDIKGAFRNSNDLNIAGNFTIDGGSYPINNNSIRFVGKKNSNYSATGGQVSWKNLVLAKEQGSTVTVVDGKTIAVTENMTATSGKLAGSVSLKGTSTQKISDNTDDLSGFMGVDIDITSSTSKPEISTDVFLRSVQFSQSVKFKLNYNNLKISNYPTKSGSFQWGTSCGFEVPATNTISAHGLSLPVLATVNTNSIFPMIVNGKYTYVNVKYTTSQVGNGAYVTVVPVDGMHPSISKGLNFYWVIKCSTQEKLDARRNVYDVYSPYTPSLSYDTYRIVVLNSEGWDDGNESSKSFKSIISGYSLSNKQSISDLTTVSGEYTISHSTSFNDIAVYHTTLSDATWSAEKWDKYNRNNSLVSSGLTSVSFSATDVAMVKNNCTLRFSESEKKFGTLTIEENAQMIVDESKASNLKPKVINGNGTLEYVMKNSRDLVFSSGNHSEFCNSEKARFIINLNGNRTLNLSGTINEFPNLEIKGTGTLTLGGTNDLLVHGNLTLSGNVKLDCTTGINVKVEKDLILGSGTEIKVGELSGEKNLTVDGDIVNNGTISRGGCPVYLWGSLENNGTINLSGDVYFTGPSGVEESLKINGSAGTGKTVLGDAIHITKSAPDCTIDFMVPVTTKGGGTTVDLQTGLLNLNQTIEPTTLKQYSSDGSASDFMIPTTASLYVSSGTVNVSLKDSKSLYLAGALNVNGGSTLNIHKEGDTSVLRGLVYSANGILSVTSSTVNMEYITPSTEGSAIEFSTHGDVIVNCLGGTPVGLLGAFDIRNGNVEISGGTVITVSSHAVSPDRTPSVYFGPANSSVDAGAQLIVRNFESSKIFMIQSLSSLGSLQVDENAELYEDDLTLLGNLVITDGKVLDTKSHDLTISGDLTLGDGAEYIAGSNTTTFNGTNSQTISSPVLSLYDMVVETSGLLVNGNVDVTNILISKGETNVADGFTLRCVGDATIRDKASITGEGIILGNGISSSKISNLMSQGKISSLIIDNIKGVYSSVPQAMPIAITTGIVMRNGVFDIAGNMIDLQGDATITFEGDSYGIDKMISVNGSLTDSGIKVHWTAKNKTKNFTIPMGKKGVVYTPIILVNVKSSNVGDLCFTANDDYYPEVKAQISDNNKALPYYWSVQCNDLKTSSGSMIFQYPKDASVDYSNYAAWYNLQMNEWVQAGLAAGNSYSNRDAFGGSFTVDGNALKLTYSTVNRTTFTSIYTAYDKTLKVQSAAAYAVMENYRDGMKWSDTDIWTPGTIYTSSGGVVEFRANPGATPGAIPEFAGAFLKDGVKLKVDQGGINAKRVCLEGNSILEILENAKNINFTEVVGTGTLKVNSEESMPSARFTDFCTKNGGTFDFSGVGKDYSVLGLPVVKNVVFSGTGKRVLRPDIDVKVLGTAVINGGDIVFSNGHSINLESEFVTTVEDASYPASLSLNGGQVSGDGYFSFDGCSLNGGSTVHEQMVNATDNYILNGLKVNNPSGVSVNNNLTVKNVVLNTGVLHLRGADKSRKKLSITEKGSIIGGSNNAFIDARVASNPVSGVEVAYPLGDYCNEFGQDTYAYAPTTVTVNTPGIWEVEYVHADPSLVYSSGISLIKEYWRVKAPNATAKAVVGLSWSARSHDSFDKGNVLVTNDGNSAEWEMLTYDHYLGDQSAGSLKTTQHQIGTSDRLYAFTKSSTSTDFIWVGRTGTEWNVKDNWMWRQVPSSSSNVVVQKTLTGKYPYLNGITAQMQKLTVESGAKITFTGGANVVFGGKVVNYGTMTYTLKSTIRANSEFENRGSVILYYTYNQYPNLYLAKAMTGNKVNVRREFNSKRWYYVGAAVVDSRSLASGTTIDYLDYFQEGTRGKVSNRTTNATEFIGSSSGGGIMKSASVIAFNTDKKVFYQTGQIQHAEVVSTTIPVASSAPGDVDPSGNPCWWTWVSMPYPFSINISAIELGEDGQEKSTLYVNGREANETDATIKRFGKFYTYNMATKVCANGDISALAPFQSVAVANHNDQPLKVTVNPIMAATSPTLKSASIEVDEPDVLRVMTRNANEVTDEAVLVFRDGGETFYTTNDSQKMNSNESSVSNISVLKDGKKCVVALYPAFYDLDEECSFPLAIEGNKNGLTIVASNIYGFDESKDVYIRDNRNGNISNLRQVDEYVVESPETLKSGDLEIVLRDAELISEPTESTIVRRDKSIRITSVDNIAIVKLDEIATCSYIKIYNMMGQEVLSNVINDTKTSIAINTDGLYLVEVVNGDERVVRKLLLKK